MASSSRSPVLIVGPCVTHRIADQTPADQSGATVWFRPAHGLGTGATCAWPLTSVTVYGFPSKLTFTGFCHVSSLCPSKQIHGLPGFARNGTNLPSLIRRKFPHSNAERYWSPFAGSVCCRVQSI